MNEEKEYLKEIEKESEETINEFSEDVKRVISQISNYTEKDIYKLYKVILENLRDLSDIEFSREEIKQKINNLNDTRTRLNFQKDLTRQDILEANYLKIYLLYLASAYLMLTPDVIEYIKRFVIVGIIGFMSYDLNARYFTSDRRKKQVRLTIKEIDKYLEISKYDIKTLEKFHEMYLDELHVELNKLLEISDFSNEAVIKANDHLLGMIKKLDLESQLQEEVDKFKIRKRWKQSSFFKKKQLIVLHIFIFCDIFLS